MPGTLFVVATPIGNLEDVTLRALRVLREVGLVAAEDTRRTGNLLRHYQIETPLLSLHEHNEEERVVTVLSRLRGGQSIALVTDAGTPGISDPGARIVRAVRQADLRVEPVPGASAVTAILSASGIEADRFLFAGFPPIRSKDRKDWLQWVTEHADIPVVCFEAPHRIEATLTELAVFSGKRPIILARELTKLHEEWTTAVIETAASQLAAPRGEFVFVLGPVPRALQATEPLPDQEVAVLFGRITENGASSRREAIQEVARQAGMTPKLVYAALERTKSPDR